MAYSNWLENNREHRRKQRVFVDKLYRERNHEKILLASRKYRKERRDYTIALKHWARNKKAKRLKDELFESHLSLCVYCQQLLSIKSIDHVIPLSGGGANDVDNIVPACRKCNASKGAKKLIVWLAQGGYQI